MKKLIDELRSANPAMSNDRYRVLKSIRAGKYSLSIQGSDGHYCAPRMTLDLDCYFKMEMAIFRGEKWVHITRSSVFRNFPRYAELKERADGINSSAPVFGYVPVDLINDLYLYLVRHGELKTSIE